MRRSFATRRPNDASRRRRGGGAGEPAAHPVPPPTGSPAPSNPNNSAALIDSREVARLLGIGRTKTFQLMASGELPTIRLGRCVRVPTAALVAWIESKTHHDSVE